MYVFLISKMLLSPPTVENISPTINQALLFDNKADCQNHLAVQYTKFVEEDYNVTLKKDYMGERMIEFVSYENNKPTLLITYHCVDVADR
jgi:hypothetical protein